MWKVKTYNLLVSGVLPDSSVSLCKKRAGTFLTPHNFTILICAEPALTLSPSRSVPGVVGPNAEHSCGVSHPLYSHSHSSHDELAADGAMSEVQHPETVSSDVMMSQAYLGPNGHWSRQAQSTGLQNADTLAMAAGNLLTASAQSPPKSRAQFC